MDVHKMWRTLSVGEFREVLKGNVAVMALSWFLFSLSGALVQPFFTLYAKNLGADDLSIAMVKSAGLLTLSLALIPGGILTDYVGRVKMIVVGTAGITVVQFLYAVVSNWNALAVVWILDEALHFYQPALSAIVMDSLPKDKTLKGFIALQAFPNLPWLFMPLIGGYLYDAYGLVGIRAGFVLSGVLSGAVTVLRLKGFRETYSYRRNNAGLSEIIRNIVGNKSRVYMAFMVYMYSALLIPVATGVFNTYSSIYVVDLLGLNKTYLGSATSVAIAFSIATSLFLTSIKRLEDRLLTLGLAGTVSIALSQAVLGVAGFVRTSPHILVVLAFTLSQVGTTLANPVTSTLLSKILSVEMRGTMSGVQRTLETLGSSLGAFVAGVLYLILGPSNSMLLSSLLGFVAAYYLSRVVRELT